MKAKKILSIALLLSISSSYITAKKAFTIGGAQKDIFIRYKDTTNVDNPSTKKKIEIQNPLTYTSTGGGSLNTAISFKRLGFVVSIFLKMGNDESSKFFLKKIEAEGINANNIILTENNGTGVSYIIPSEQGNNTVLIYRGANEFIKPDELPEKEIKSSDILYITSLSGESKNIFLPAVQMAKKGNAVVAVNPGSTQIRHDSEILKKALPYIDILMLNQTETKHLIYELVQLNPELQPILDKTNGMHADIGIPELLREQIAYESISFNLIQFFKIILDLGPKIAIVTAGAHGVYVATKQYVYFFPALPVNVVNTTGAGDAFNSCFTAVLLKDNKSIEEAIENNTIEKAIRFAAIDSASVVSFMDTNKGLLNQDEIEIKSGYIQKDLLQKFALE